MTFGRMRAFRTLCVWGLNLILSAVEIAHIAFLGEWNSEIFAAATGLIGTVSGILISTRA